MRRTYYWCGLPLVIVFIFGKYAGFFDYSWWWMILFLFFGYFKKKKI